MNEFELRKIISEIENDPMISTIARNILVSAGEAYLQFLRISGRDFRGNERVRNLYEIELNLKAGFFGLLFSAYVNGDNIEAVLDSRYAGGVRAILEDRRKDRSDDEIKILESVAKEVREQLLGLKRGYYVPTELESRILNY